MDSFLCIKYGLVDDEGDLRVEDEHGDDVCIADGEWQNYFEEG